MSRIGKAIGGRVDRMVSHVVELINPEEIVHNFFNRLKGEDLATPVIETLHRVDGFVDRLFGDGERFSDRVMSRADEYVRTDYMEMRNGLLNTVAPHDHNVARRVVGKCLFVGARVFGFVASFIFESQERESARKVLTGGATDFLANQFDYNRPSRLEARDQRDAGIQQRFALISQSV